MQCLQNQHCLYGLFEALLVWSAIIEALVAWEV